MAYDYYAILGVTTNAENIVIAAAYKALVKKYHPDKLKGLGEEHLKGAQEKFQQIQDAYELIKKEKNIK